MSNKFIKIDDGFWLIPPSQHMAEIFGMWRKKTGFCSTIKTPIDVKLLVVSGQISKPRKRYGYFRRWFEWLVSLGDD